VLTAIGKLKLNNARSIQVRRVLSAVSKSIAHRLDLVLIDLISRQIPLLVPERANGAPEF
jgi:hypothetical protein